MNAPNSAHVACPHPCSSCPWLTANHGKPHPNGWFTKSNRTRLWAKLKTGDSMSCHKTDVNNPVPEGHAQVPADATVKECTGGLILQQREMMNFQEFTREKGSGFKLYRAANPNGMTRVGLRVIVERALFGGLGSLVMARPDLHEPVSHDRCIWNPKEKP